MANSPLPHSAPEIAAALSAQRRVLLVGDPGSGKSTLSAALGAAFQARGEAWACLSGDPGNPAFGIPGAVCLGRWQNEGWRMLAYEAICSLNAGRFRLPLVMALTRLQEGSAGLPLLIDAPGVIRGVAGAELIDALCAGLSVDAVVALGDEDRPPPLSRELTAAGVPVYRVAAHPAARRHGKRRRARERSALWQAYLADAEETELSLSRLQVVGTPPPRVPGSAAWQGRQIALLSSHETLVMGQVLALEADRLHARLPPWPKAQAPTALLVRDAQVDAAGLLTSAPALQGPPLTYLPPPSLLPPSVPQDATGPRPAVRVGLLDAALINGVLGDPLLHLRLRHQKRSLLLDLGEARRLPARICHQISDVLISHCHLDHIAGFVWLLRSRIAELPPCRLYGPPGLAGHIAGLLRGVLWDRIGDRGPRFLIHELHGERILQYRLQAGIDTFPPPLARAVDDGTFLEDAGFRVRAVTLDHGTPVLAFALEPSMSVLVRKERLAALGLAPGPWLTLLKRHILAGELDAPIQLPDGGQAPCRNLARQLTLSAPGKRLVCATDFADTADNRARLVSLARGAHTLFCEASFRTADADQARRTGHLTTRACGEIASAAEVEQLIPFHFSRRYEQQLDGVYDEIAEAYPALTRPGTALTK
jgi:ribonuclease Z